MKDSEVYLKAAKLIAENNDYSCCIIDEIAGDRGCHSAARMRYEKYFRLNGRSRIAWLENDPMPWNDQQNWRVLALLFMHHIAKDKEKA